MPDRPFLCGIDFTSAPRRAKPITVAQGRLFERDRIFRLERMDRLEDWQAFESWLHRPGPWIGGFDFPFGLPREAVRDLGWPDEWSALANHCHAMGRPAFRAMLDAYRESRPVGRRYPHRSTDGPAGSHSPLKLINPPVGLMFFEGAKRLADAEVSIPMMRMADASRIALEAYPGLAARAITRAPYKSDDRSKQTPQREAARSEILGALVQSGGPFDFVLELPAPLARALVDDASGDLLDAVLAAMQAAWGYRRRHRNYGLPPDVDPVEGWILMA